jgi:uncharacterized protein (TIGR02466 family)
MTLEGLFPTPIGFFKFEDGLTDAQTKFLVDQQQRPNDGNTSSENRYILREKVVANLTTFIEKCAHEYFMATFSPKNDVRLRITQSWLNWTKPGQFHHKHAHPNSFISGCFYPKADKTKDKIFFYKDGYQPIKFPPVEWNLFNSDSWWFPVGSGDLIFFPSHLTHMVQTVDADDTRISLAFNTYPIGHIGDEDELTALYLGK